MIPTAKQLTLLLPLLVACAGEPSLGPAGGSTEGLSIETTAGSDLLNAGCLNADVDVASFDPATDLVVKIDITDAAGVTHCAGIVDASGEATADADANNSAVCVVRPERIGLSASSTCSAGIQVTFIGFTPPTGSVVFIEYLAVPE